MSVSRRSSNNVRTHVNDEYRLSHIRTTTTTVTDANNQRHTFQNKETKTATQSQSRSYNNSNRNQLSITGQGGSGYGGGSNQARVRNTYTETSKNSYRGPNKQDNYSHTNRNFHSEIQRESYNAPPVTYRSGYAQVARNNDYYYDSD